MAISFVQSKSGSATNGNNITLTFDAGLQEGDLVLVAQTIPVASDTVMAWPATQGYTLLADLYANDNTDTNLGVYGKFMGASPDATVVVDGNSAGLTEGITVVAMVFRGVDRTRPLDVAIQTATGINSVLADPPAITPVTSGAAVVAVFAGGHIAATQTFTGPTNYTTNFVTVGASDTNDSTTGMGYNLSPNIGSAENPGACTFSAADDVAYSWAAVSIALRPAEVRNITVVGAATGTANDGGAVTINLPTCQENDLVIVAACIPDTADRDISMTTAGYTEVADLYQNDVEDCNLGVFYKKMGATPDTTAVVNGSGSGLTSGNSAVAVVFRGVDTATPMDVAAVTAGGANSGIPDPGSIDYTDTDPMLVIVGATGLTSSTAGYIFPYPYFGHTAINIADTDQGQVCIAYAPKYLVSDPENPGPIYRTSPGLGLLGSTPQTNESWNAVTMALRKAVSGALQPVIIVVGL